MSPVTPPSLVFRGTRSPAEEVAAVAGSWAASLAGSLRPAPRAIAIVMANHPESVALFFALSCLPAPVVLLPPDLRPWRSSPPVPAGTHVVLLGSQREFAADARALGVEVTVLPDAAPAAASHPPFLSTPGVVLFTSGSTGGSRPVFRRTAALLATTRNVIAALGLGPGDGIVTSLPIARAFGLHHGLMSAAMLGGTLALLDRFEHTALLRLFASGAYRYWPGMPTMADVLSRCALSGPPAAPPICAVGARVSADLASRFASRFGVPLRQSYGTTETGAIAIDGSPAEQVRTHTVGRAVPSVEIRVGRDPHEPEPAGMHGRIWVSAPATMMEGYGFPPELERLPTVDGWWATPDIGRLDGGRYLEISGRVDDTFRTGAGHLVSPGPVALSLERYPGVKDAAVVPLRAPGGPVLGVLVESAEPIAPDDLREHLATALPAWYQPRVIRWTGALPRLAAGKIDRQACIAILEQALGAPA